jgi:uncharacterized membrane protein
MIKLIIEYINIFFLFSVLGRLGEWAMYPIIKKSVIKRGLVKEPYCLIYGCGAILIIFILNLGINNNFIFVVISGLIMAILEYLASYFMEKIFHKRWWDYSKYKFNLNGRIALQYIVSYVFYALIFKIWIYPHLFDWIGMINHNILTTLAIILPIMLVIDAVTTVRRELRLKIISI